MKIEPERFFDVDDERVLVFVYVTAEGEGSGVPVRGAERVRVHDPRRGGRALERLRRPNLAISGTYY